MKGNLGCFSTIIIWAVLFAFGGWLSYNTTGNKWLWLYLSFIALLIVIWYVMNFRYFSTYAFIVIGLLIASKTSKFYWDNPNSWLTILFMGLLFSAMMGTIWRKFVGAIGE